jgi:hypothetical protein
MGFKKERERERETFLKKYKVGRVKVANFKALIRLG